MNMMQNVKQKLVLAVLLLACQLPIVSWQSAACAQTRRALIFGLGEQEDTRWAKLSGDNDVRYVRQMLLRMGYADIRTLVNEQATKQGMTDALLTLALRCERGDHIYIHYSGHGQLMTDLDGDERLKWSSGHAGYDEAWIPYDAYMTPCNEDNGEKHLSDDEVAYYLRAIRKRIGRRGRLTVVVDACHSGDATAAADSDEDDEVVRGVDTKFVVPLDPAVPQATQVVREEWQTISACKPYQLSTEMKTPQVGKLTYALYTLGAAAFELDNAELEAVLTLFMEQHKGRLTQTPMVRGGKRGEGRGKREEW